MTFEEYGHRYRSKPWLADAVKSMGVACGSVPPTEIRMDAGRLARDLEEAKRRLRDADPSRDAGD